MSRCAKYFPSVSSLVFSSLQFGSVRSPCIKMLCTLPPPLPASRRSGRFGQGIGLHARVSFLGLAGLGSHGRICIGPRDHRGQRSISCSDYSLLLLPYLPLLVFPQKFQIPSGSVPLFGVCYFHPLCLLSMACSEYVTYLSAMLVPQISNSSWIRSSKKQKL